MGMILSMSNIIPSPSVNQTSSSPLFCLISLAVKFPSMVILLIISSLQAEVSVGFGIKIDKWFVASFSVIQKVYIDLRASHTEQSHLSSLGNYPWLVTKFEPLAQFQILPLPQHLEKFNISVGYGVWKCRVREPTNLLKVLIHRSLAFKVGVSGDLPWCYPMPPSLCIAPPVYRFTIIRPPYATAYAYGTITDSFHLGHPHYKLITKHAAHLQYIRFVPEYY